jgi:hypothetical protein
MFTSSQIKSAVIALVVLIAYKQIAPRLGLPMI